MSNEGEVYFALFGRNLDPNVVTDLIGLQPTSTHRLAPPKDSSWELSSGKVEGELIDVYLMASDLVSRLLPHQDGIIRAKQQCGLQAVLQVVLRVSVDESVSTPAIGFTSEVINFLSSVGASVDVDTYRNVP